jgi:hypothetical protein
MRGDVATGLERATNVFLRTDVAAVVEGAGLAAGTAAVDVFTALRSMKDSF